MSKTQQFIDLCKNNYSGEGVVYEIDKEYFWKEIKETPECKAEPAYYYKSYGFYEYGIHPLQKIYLIRNYSFSYPSGGSEWEIMFFFKYKGRYYSYIEGGGS